jgi:hypothetical protein
LTGGCHVPEFQATQEFHFYDTFNRVVTLSIEDHAM